MQQDRSNPNCEIIRCIPPHLLSTPHRIVHVSLRYDRWRNQSCSDGMLIVCVGGGGGRGWIAFVVLKRRREKKKKI